MELSNYISSLDQKSTYQPRHVQVTDQWRPEVTWARVSGTIEHRVAWAVLAGVTSLGVLGIALGRISGNDFLNASLFDRVTLGRWMGIGLGLGVMVGGLKASQKVFAKVDWDKKDARSVGDHASSMVTGLLKSVAVIAAVEGALLASRYVLHQKIWTGVMGATHGAAVPLFALPVAATFLPFNPEKKPRVPTQSCV